MSRIPVIIGVEYIKFMDDKYTDIWTFRMSKKETDDMVFGKFKEALAKEKLIPIELRDTVVKERIAILSPIDDAAELTPLHYTVAIDDFEEPTVKLDKAVLTLKIQVKYFLSRDNNGDFLIPESSPIRNILEECCGQWGPFWVNS